MRRAPDFPVTPRFAAIHLARSQTGLQTDFSECEQATGELRFPASYARLAQTRDPSFSPTQIRLESQKCQAPQLRFAVRKQTRRLSCVGESRNSAGTHQ